MPIYKRARFPAVGSPDVRAFRDTVPRRVETRLEAPNPSYPQVSFSPYVFPPESAIEIDRYAQGDVAAGASVTLSSLAFTLPAGMIGVLRWFANYTPIVPTATINGPPAAAVYFTLRVNEGAVMPYNRVYLSLGAIDNPTKIFVRLPRQAKIDILIANESAAIQTIAGRFKGWYWPDRAVIGRAVLEEGGQIDEGGSLV